MTTGAFYGYYNSKEELFAALSVLVYIAGLMCSHMAAFRIATNSNIARMNEILDCPVQSGEEKLTNKDCDIVFDHVGFAYDGGGKTTVSRLIKNKTVLIIAHRMRTVSGADKIVVLKDGRVEEEGNPAARMQKEGIFPHMVKLQTEGQNWALQ